MRSVLNRRRMRMFDPQKPVYARRRLQTRGLEFGIREEIPWREFEISQKTIERWFRLRLIDHTIIPATPKPELEEEPDGELVTAE